MLEYLNKDIKILSLNKEINEILLKNNIKMIKDVWVLKRKDLKNLGLKDSEIKDIIISLQLICLDLNKKRYI